MKLKLLIAIMFGGLYLSAQNFTEYPFSIPFEGVLRSSIAFSDVDGNGHEDVLITGFGDSGARISKLYLSDGEGNFNEKTGTSFEGVDSGDVGFINVDGDNDNDVLITGVDNDNFFITKLYLNDGQANFTEVSDTPFEGVASSSIAFSDVDGDTAPDILITGRTNQGVFISKLYLNDGFGNFTEMVNTPFEGVLVGSIAFSDVDGDNDEDVLITGSTNTNTAISKLYLNDGFGNFAEMIDTPFEGVVSSSIAFSDVDGDNDKDVLITGENNDFLFISKLYLNDGQGNFTEVMDTPFYGINRGSIAFSDTDGDNDEDVLISGERDRFTGENISILYINDGLGNFSEVIDTPFKGIKFGSIAFSDTDGDSDMDLLITGNFQSPADATAILYLNDGQGNFAEPTPFEPVRVGTIAFSDIDGDNDEDLLITGENNFDAPTAKLYLNEGMGNFTEIVNTPFEEINMGSMAFADVDGDGDEDVLLTGRNSSDIRIAKLYTNDGLGNFIEVMGTPFEPVWRSTIAFSDVDGDNDEDVMIIGQNSDFQNISKLYLNDGQGNFTEVVNTPFEGVDSGTIAFADVDGDNDNDVLITGRNINFQFISKLYLNDGQGNFSEVVNTPFEGVVSGTIAFADVDGDNDEDVLMKGDLTGIGSMLTKLYINDGQGNFSEMLDTPFEESGYGSIVFADVDGDNDEDVLMTGYRNDNKAISKLYINDGQGNFSEMQDTPFVKIGNSSIAFSDFNNDSRLDIFMTGQKRLGYITTKLYFNQIMPTNIIEPNYTTELTVIPNPFQKSTIFRIKEIPGDRGKLNIYNTNGILIFSQAVVSNSDVTFRKEGLAGGIYFYEVVDHKNERVFRGKVIKH